VRVAYHRNMKCGANVT